MKSCRASLNTLFYQFSLLSCLILVLSACGASKQSTVASVKIFQGVAQLSVSNATGGLVLFGKSNNGDHFSRVVDPSNGEVELTLRNGNWVFSSMAWDHATDAFRGTVRCGITQPQQLNGTDLNIDLSLTNSTCNTTPFKGSSTLNAGAFPEFRPLNCKNISFNPASPPPPFTYDNVCDNTAMENRKGTIGSLKVMVESFDYINGNFQDRSGSLSSVCLKIDDTSNAVRLGALMNKTTGATANVLNLPPGNGSILLPFKVIGYFGNETCTNDSAGVKTFNFPYGMASGSSDTLFYSYLNSTYKQNIYLRTTDSDACAGGRLTATPFAGGTGSVSHPYIICTRTQLNAIGTTYETNNFHLANDINFESTYTFTPIGDAASPFTGKFFGNNHTVSNIDLNLTSATDEWGFFRRIGTAAVVSNLNLHNIKLNGGLTNNMVGVLAGKINGGGTAAIIRKVFVTNSLVNSGNQTGGLVGTSSAGDLNQVHVAYTTVKGDDEVGGLIGQVGSGAGNMLANSSFEGDVLGAMASVGGLIGYMQANINLSAMRTAGSVTGDTNVGGFVGEVCASCTTNISDSYTLATVKGMNSATSYVGGFVGHVQAAGSSTVTTSFQTGGSIINNSAVAPFATYGNVLGSGSCTNGYFTGPSGNHSSCTVRTVAQMVNNSLVTALGAIGNTLPPANTWYKPSGDNTYDFPQLAWEKEWEDTKLTNLKRTCSGIFNAPTGNGSSSSPYSVCTATQFIGMTSGNYYILKQDIDLTDFASTTATKIATMNYSLNGDGRSVTNLKTEFSSTCASTMGYIGTLASGNYLKNVNFRGPKFTYSGNCTNASFTLGVLVGINQGTIENVTADGIKLSLTGVYNLSTGVQTIRVGGLVGHNSTSNSVLRKVKAFGRIENGASLTNASDDLFYMGGMVGQNIYGALVEKSIGGMIINKSGAGYTNHTSVGGIVALNAGAIKEVKSMGSFGGSPSGDTGINNHFVGGIAGTNSGVVQDVFSTVSFTMPSPNADPATVGGVVGLNFTNSYNGVIRRAIYQKIQGSNNFFSGTSKGAIIGNHDTNVGNVYQDLLCFDGTSGTPFGTSSGLSGITNGTNGTISAVTTSCFIDSNLPFNRSFSGGSGGYMTLEDQTTYTFTTSSNWLINDDFADAVSSGDIWLYKANSTDYLELVSLQNL